MTTCILVILAFALLMWPRRTISFGMLFLSGIFSGAGLFIVVGGLLIGIGNMAEYLDIFKLVLGVCAAVALWRVVVVKTSSKHE